MTAFWDASAIVPLCCSQRGSRDGRVLLKALPRQIVWWGTPVEARSAFARLRREQQLTDAQHAAARRLLEQLRHTWDEVQPSEQVRTLAEELPDAHGIRAADAMQLAAALLWCGERPRRRPFVCLDDRLSAAAASLGFSVHP